MAEFTIAGVPIRHSYDFPHADTPGGVRRVLGRYATARQMQMSDQASPEDMARVIAKVGSDLDASLWDHRDR